MDQEDREQKARRSHTHNTSEHLGLEERAVFAKWLSVLNDARVPYLVGGAFAVHKYTGIWRYTKDLDLFLKPANLRQALDALSAAGFDTEVRDRYWLAKANKDPYVLDLIFSVAYSYIVIDDAWFESKRTDMVAGIEVPLIGVEELIASKIYVTRSDRFDGSDIVHAIKAVEGKVNWDRLLRILKDDGVLLLWYLILFDYIYPGHAEYLPQDLMADLFDRARKGWARTKNPKSFYGMMIDPLRFQVDISDWGYIDERLPLGPLVDPRGEPI
ncbi:MAG: hypothetical protein A4E57_03884 [Syntrophorhabdaceae bacterium PtaU1.Bin034]|nr:MAG: hypothetical protein A4E57_03884 [Syntrophorhabdaceae bacterium PtaU1.Bin034]